MSEMYTAPGDACGRFAQCCVTATVGTKFYIHNIYMYICVPRELM